MHNSQATHIYMYTQTQTTDNNQHEVKRLYTPADLFEEGKDPSWGNTLWIALPFLDWTSSSDTVCMHMNNTITRLVVTCRWFVLLVRAYMYIVHVQVHYHLDNLLTGIRVEPEYMITWKCTCLQEKILQNFLPVAMDWPVRNTGTRHAQKYYETTPLKWMIMEKKKTVRLPYTCCICSRHRVVF